MSSHLPDAEISDVEPASLAPFAAFLALVATALIALGVQEGGGGALWPDVIRAFHVSNGLYGVAGGVGLTLAFPLFLYGGRLTSRFDKRSLMAFATGMMALAGVGLMVGHGAAALIVVLALRGVGVGMLDLSANALAMDVEQLVKRHVMSPLHAGYSGGTVVGAAIAWAVFALGGGFRAVYAIIICLLLLNVGFAARERRRTRLPRTRTAVAGTSSGSLVLFRRADIRAICLLTGVSFGGEILISQWIGIYLRDERHYVAASAAWAVILLGTAMFVGRLINGPLTEKLGERMAIGVQGVLTLIGAGMIVGSNTLEIAVAGCGVAGLGLAGVAPTALSLAGKAVPTASGAASGAALMAGYGMGAAIPFLAGLVASIWSVRVVLCGELIFGSVVVAVSWWIGRFANEQRAHELAPRET